MQAGFAGAVTLGSRRDSSGPSTNKDPPSTTDHLHDLVSDQYFQEKALESRRQNICSLTAWLPPGRKRDLRGDV